MKPLLLILAAVLTSCSPWPPDGPDMGAKAWEVKFKEIEANQ